LTLTAKDVAEIIKLLEQSRFDSLSLEMDGIKLNLQRGSTVPVSQIHNNAAAETASTAPPPPPSAKARPPSKPGLLDVTSPFLGIFYRAPKPGQPPFIEVASKVQQDTVIGIIEVMKLMNSVPACVKGEVVEIVAENGALVEYGEVLLRVRPEPSP
jgi:acetyl-CoA carboxylase biotin carboxyl carrier protein